MDVAGLALVPIGQVAGDLGHGQLGCDGHTVVGALAVRLQKVAAGAEDLAGDLVVLKFELVKSRDTARRIRR